MKFNITFEINDQLLMDFDKSLTPEELDAESYLDWSDETLGRLVRLQAKQMFDPHDGWAAAQVVAACQCLGSLVTKAGKRGYRVECQSQRIGRFVVDISMEDRGRPQ